MPNERLMRAVAKLTDPAQKLRLMVGKGLIDEANAFIDDLLHPGEVPFWFSTNSATNPTSLLEAGTPDRDREALSVRFDVEGVTPPGGDDNEKLLVTFEPHKLLPLPCGRGAWYAVNEDDTLVVFLMRHPPTN